MIVTPKTKSWHDDVDQSSLWCTFLYILQLISIIRSVHTTPQLCCRTAPSCTEFMKLRWYCISSSALVYMCRMKVKFHFNLKCSDAGETWVSSIDISAMQCNVSMNRPLLCKCVCVSLKGHWTTSASSPNFFQKSWDFYIIRSVYLCRDCMLNLICSFNSVTKIYAFFFQ